MRPTLARVAGVGRVEVLLERHARDRGRRRPDAAARRRADGARRRGRRCKAANRLAPGRRATPRAGTQHLVLASGLWRSVGRHRGDAGPGEGRRDGPRARPRRRLPRRAGPHVTLVTGNGRPRAIVTVSQQIGANILDVRDGVEAALATLTHSAARRACTLTKIYDLAEFVADAIANVRDAILIGGLLAVLVLLRVPARLAAHDRGRAHAAAHGVSPRSSSCGSSASRST